MLRHAGSPPQVRGKPGRTCYKSENRRITPAGAGKTDITVPTVGMQWDHPRRCGENFLLLHRKSHSTGSPPQVRGKPARAARVDTCHWITPAGAGKTNYDVLNANFCEDHPRRCGENLLSFLHFPVTPGSPPQVRGKHDGSGTNVYSSGITPAGAGKTAQECQCRTPLEDHPRRCGENACKENRKAGGLGSPPQVRGKHKG